MTRVLSGLAASPGRASGTAHILGAGVALDRTMIRRSERKAEAGVARDALERAARELEAVSARLRSAGRAGEGEIVDASAMIARDPSLEHEAVTAIFDHGVPAAAAILDAAVAQAEVIAALDDPLLAERADDVRSVGRRAAALADAGTNGESAVGEAGQVLVAADLGPAEVAEVEESVGAIALAGGGISAHAAIVARSLGIPMVVGVGAALLDLDPGGELVVDGSAGTVVADPDEALVTSVASEQRRLRVARTRAISDRDLPAVTADGRRVTVLANVAGAAELATALREGAEGIGLLRTELAFLDATDWPSEAEYLRALAPIFADLDGAPATVRVLDFGGDKTPPFLRGTTLRGIELLLRNRDHLETQLRAILIAAAGAEVRIMLPMVESGAQMRAARAVLESANGRTPPLGAMIETVPGVEAVDAIAGEAEFLSIGTNDLTHSVLSSDRFSTTVAPAQDPAVLRAIETVVLAAERAGIPVEVCGEAASDPVTVPLLVGSGVDELSVGAARVGAVRHWIRCLNYGESRVLVAHARLAVDSAQVDDLTAATVDRLSLDEGGNPGGEVREGPVGVGTNGAQAEPRSSPGA